MSDEGDVVAGVEADFAPKRAVGLDLGPSGAAGLVHLVVPVPVELNGSVVTTTGEASSYAGDWVTTEV